MKRITWKRYEESIKNIIHHFKGYEIGKVVGIYKGGLIPAVQIANALKVPLDIVVYQSYDGNTKEPIYAYNTGKKNKVLIVDDIIDTGNTIKKVVDLIDAKEIYIASLVVKTEGFGVLRELDKELSGGSLVSYYIPYYEPSKDCISFPWETLDNFVE